MQTKYHFGSSFLECVFRIGAFLLVAFQHGVPSRVLPKISACLCWEIHDLLSPEWGCGDVVSGTSASPVGHVDGLPWPSR
jgi:hypothetical protein